MNSSRQKGFTLIEILVVVAIIAILASVVFVALDPLTRFRNTRDSSRWNDVTELSNAIKLDQLDNGGEYIAAINSMAAGSVYMVVNGALMTSGCDDNNASCDTAVTGDAYCVNLAGLITEGYMGNIPISPKGAVTWDDGDNLGDEGTGYTLQRDATGIIHIRSCESENTSEISVSK
jgi:prepilin-type N-terminal cleavage/methylation domain-containing protein